jgi:transposase-like protein
MALSPNFHSVNLTFVCPQCGHPLVKHGSWFKSAKGFKCQSCKSYIRLTYTLKLALFRRAREQVEHAGALPEGAAVNSDPRIK